MFLWPDHPCDFWDISPIVKQKRSPNKSNHLKCYQLIIIVSTAVNDLITSHIPIIKSPNCVREELILLAAFCGLLALSLVTIPLPPIWPPKCLSGTSLLCRSTQEWPFKFMTGSKSKNVSHSDHGVRCGRMSTAHTCCHVNWLFFK